MNKCTAEQTKPYKFEEILFYKAEKEKNFKVHYSYIYLITITDDNNT